MAEKWLMKRVYYDPAHPCSFGGGERLRRAVQDVTGEKVGMESVKDFLSEQDAYTLHEPARMHFTHNRVFVSRPLNQFQADLSDMQALVDTTAG